MVAYQFHNNKNVMSNKQSFRVIDSMNPRKRSPNKICLNHNELFFVDSKHSVVDIDKVSKVCYQVSKVADPPFSAKTK